MTLPGKFEVNANGAATYHIPIAVPPGTSGMVPALSLEYSSQGGDGILGVGWSLAGLPAIGRCARTKAQDGVVGGVNYDANDRFCMDGQRLIVISGTYGADGAEYRTEVESFNRVISHGTAGTGPAWFEVRTKSGQVMEFGHTTDSQVLAQGKTTARSWSVNKISDTKGNYLTVTYTQDSANGQAYPARIDYTGNTAAGIATYNSVQFVYATRTDQTPLYQAGSLLKITQRLTDVKTYAGATLVADYKLAYQQSTATQRSELTSVTLCAGDGSCLPPTSLTWTGAATAFSTPISGTTISTDNMSTTWIPMMADVNGDGKTDLVITYLGASGWLARVALSNGDGTFAPYVATTLYAGAISSPWTQMVADVNGDGKADLINIYVGDSGWEFRVALSNGDGTFAPFTFGVLTSANLSTTWVPAMADVNGDGRADLVITYMGLSGWMSKAALSNGDGTFGPLVETTLYSAAISSTRTQMLADINGDGKADIVATYIGPSGWDALVALSNGDGTFGPFIYNLATSANMSTTWVPTMADVNGDGKADLVITYVGASGWMTRVLLSKGDGTFLPYVETDLITTAVSGPWTQMMGDVNGDGKADLVANYLGGSGWQARVALSNGNGSFAPYVETVLVSSAISAPWAPMFADINGDGKADFVLSNVDSTGWQARAAMMGGGVNDLASTVVSGLGSTTAVTYAPLANSTVYTKDTNAVYPLLDIKGPMYVVSRLDASNGIGGTYSSTYSYAGAKADLSGRGFLGFRQMTATDLQTSIVHATTFRQDFPYLGLTASDTKTLSTQTLNQATNTYQFSNAAGAATISTPSNTSAPYRVSLAQSVAASFDLDGSVIPAATTTYQYDTFGNATQVVTSTPDGFSKTTTSTYSNDTTLWYLGRLTTATVTSITP